MSKRCVVAYAGGLPSSYLVARLARAGQSVIAVTVDAGQLDEELGEVLSRRARELGADEHEVIDARRHVFERYVAYLLKANARHADCDPLWTAAEAYGWADHVAKVAARLGATAVASAADLEDDALRFGRALTDLAPELERLDPIGAEDLSPSQQASYLADAGLGAFETPDADGYRARESLWGRVVVGGDLDDLFEPPEDDELFEGPPPWEAAELPEQLDVELTEGIPQGAFGSSADPLNLVEQLGRLGRRHGVGRALGLEERVAGPDKRRVALQVPAATILLTAHRALELAVLGDDHLRIKDEVARHYAELFRVGRYHASVCRDLEAFLDSSQRTVTGRVRLKVYRGCVEVLGVEPK